MASEFESAINKAIAEATANQRRSLFLGVVWLLMVLVATIVAWSFLDRIATTEKSLVSLKTDLTEVRKAADDLVTRSKIAQVQIEIIGKESLKQLDQLQQQVGDISKLPKVLAWVNFRGNNKTVFSKYNIKDINRTGPGAYNVYFENQPKGHWAVMMTGTAGFVMLNQTLDTLQKDKLAKEGGFAIHAFVVNSNTRLIEYGDMDVSVIVVGE